MAILTVNFCQDSEDVISPLHIPTDSNNTVEHAILAAATSLKLRPVTLSLLGLRVLKSKLWLAPAQLLAQLPEEALTVQLRLRFQPCSYDKLKEYDEMAYKYFYMQIRHDYIREEFSLPSEDGMGLVVADIVHHMHVSGVKLGAVEIKHFMPPSLNKYVNRHIVKRHVDKSQAEAESSPPAFIRQQYLHKVLECVSEQCVGPDSDNTGCLFGAEEQLVKLQEGAGTDYVAVRMMVAPFHPHQPGIRVTRAKRGGWSVLCHIEDLVVISSCWSDLTLEVFRKTGMPYYLQMPSVQSMYSLVSCLTGYYRLLKCWTFDLCKEVPTPIIHQLRKHKCHGPVGAVFAHAKLLGRCGSEVGAALLRQSSRRLGCYRLDVVQARGRLSLRTFTIIEKNNQVIMEDAGTNETFDSLSKLFKYLLNRSKNVDTVNIESTTDGSASCVTKELAPGSEIADGVAASTSASHGVAAPKEASSGSAALYVTRMLPPSDYDKPELLLLSAGPVKQDGLEENSAPKVYRLDHFVSDAAKVLHGSFYRVMQAKTRADQTRHVAVKIPNLSSLEHTQRFLHMCDDWMRVCDSGAVVAAMGITLNPVTLVMEWVPLGPLDRYLSENWDSLAQVDLLEAVTHLAKALFFLSQESIRHLNIRCHSLLVARHQDSQFLVKLSDPGCPVLDSTALHWLPREHHRHPPTSRHDPSTDVWAFATTSWQIFSKGIWPLQGGDLEEIRCLYAAGHVLPQPPLCPKELYKIMLLCWSRDPSARRQPQTIMRDTFQILYEVFNARRHNAYSVITEEDPPDSAVQEEGKPDRLSQDNPLYASQSDGSTYQKQNGSTDTTTTTLGSTISEVTLVDVGDGEEGEELLSTLPTQLTNLRLTDGSHLQVRMSLLPPCVAPMPALPDTCLVPPADLPLLPPAQAQQRVDTQQQPLNLSQLLVPPSQPDDGQLLPGQILRMKRSSVRIDAAVGEGNYGWVYRGHLTTPGGGPDDGPVAVKTLKVVTGQLEDMVRERDIMEMLRDSNIVRLLGFISEGVSGADERLLMVMEYLPLGSVKTYLQQNSHVEDLTLLDFSLDVASGMDYLEVKRIVHRDLAARNLLVASSNHVKISDFGLAQQLHDSSYYVLRTSRDLPLSWYAPESIKMKRYSHKTDVWSYGVTCWEMFTRGHEPILHRDPDALLKALEQGTRLNCIPPCPELVYSRLMRVCWDHDPRQRPNFSDLVGIVQELKNDLTWWRKDLPDLD